MKNLPEPPTDDQSEMPHSDAASEHLDELDQEIEIRGDEEPSVASHHSNSSHNFVSSFATFKVQCSLLFSLDKHLTHKKINATLSFTMQLQSTIPMASVDIWDF